ncbi:MAG: hypothetical protein GY771_05130 [bacterium]|nr:hypothetical protein [bacterium]
MFAHMSIHYPKKDKVQLLIDSMHRFGEAMSDQPGLQRAHVLKDETTGRLIGLAIWDDKDDMQKARPAMATAIKDDDFEAWESKPPEIFYLSEV